MERLIYSLKVKKNEKALLINNGCARIAAIDGVRGVAILAIIVCHICYGFSSDSILGQYLGGTFNYVFLFISAYLLGLKYSMSHKVYGGVFLKRRIMRLGTSLYPFLLLVIGVCYIKGIPISPLKVAMNFLFLGWVAKLPGNGHLWFVTMIMLTYVSYVFLSRVKERNKSKLAFGMLLLIPLSIVVSLLGLPGYCFLMLMSCCLIFFYAEQIRNYLSNLQWEKVLCLYFFANLITLYCFMKNLIEIGHITYYYLTLLTGIASFLLLYKLFYKRIVARFFVFTSSISFELYLVHHPISDYHLFMPLTNNKTLSVIFIFVVSYVGAYILHKMVKLHG